MSVALDELLLLVGRLDDAPGFDAARERFRRFLLERVTDASTARTLIEECQQSVGEQRHRALQDLVVLIGRLLGFEIGFGAYERAPQEGGADGQWRSPGLLTVMLHVRTEQTADAPLDALAAAVTPPSEDSVGDSRIGLCVVGRQFAARARLGELIAADARLRQIRVVSVQSLLSLAAQVAARRVAHEEVVKLLRSGFSLDFVIELVDRPANGKPSEDNGAAASPGVAAHSDPAFWVATITGNEMSAASRVLQSVIAHRRVLAIYHAGRFRADGAPGDWVCFFLPGKGVVGHAQLMSVIEDGASVVRHASRFSRVYRLADVTLYEQPIARALRAERPFGVPPVDVPLAGACLAPIAKEDFLSLTTYGDGAPGVERRRSATA